METRIVKHIIDSNSWITTYKYWKIGECACKAIKITRKFDSRPTAQELIQAI